MWKQLIDQVEASTLYKWYGQVKKVTGLTIESSGPRSFIGELCYIWTGQDKKRRFVQKLLALTTTVYCSCLLIASII